jgi:hypothetical protein
LESAGATREKAARAAAIGPFGRMRRLKIEEERIMEAIIFRTDKRGRLLGLDTPPIEHSLV